MNRNRIYILFLFVFIGFVLSACAGGGATATSWPGFTIDESSGTVYLAYNTHVYAIDLTNGTEKWRFPSEPDNKMTFFAPPALTVDGQLIVGGYNGVLYSLDPENGGENWAFSEASSRYIAGPVVNGERIYAPNSDHRLYVLDFEGNLIWSFETEFEQWASPLVNREVLYLPAMDHRIYALDAESGALIWSADELGGALAGTPALESNSSLYIGTLGSAMLALDGQNGAELWRSSTDGWVWSGPALDGGVIYFGDMSGKFYALEASDGSKKWDPFQLEGVDKPGISGTPLVVDDTVYFGAESGDFMALDAITGNSRWRKTLDGSLFSGPQAAGDTILVAPVSKEVVLIAMDNNGNQVWSFIPQKE